MLKGLFRARHSAHAWAPGKDEWHRKCSICGEQQEFLHDGDEFRGLVWETFHVGDRKAHALPATDPSSEWPGVSSVIASIRSSLTSR